jgi:hypothetical protein
MQANASGDVLMLIKFSSNVQMKMALPGHIDDRILPRRRQG